MANQKIIDTIVSQKAIDEVLRLIEVLKQLNEVSGTTLSAMLKYSNAQGKPDPKIPQLINEEVAALKAKNTILNTITTQQAKYDAVIKQFPGSINAMKASIGQMTIQLNTLVDVEGKGAAKAHELRKAIDDTNASIKKNSDAISNQKANIGNYGSAWEKTGAFIIAAGIAIYEASKQVVEFGIEAFKSFEAVSRQERLLLNAMDGRKDLTDYLIEQAKKLRDVTGVDEKDIISVQKLAATHKLSAKEIEKVTLAALNLAAVTGDDLNSAATKILSTYEGQIGRLGKLDSKFKELTETELKNGAAIDLINDKYAGMAEKGATSTAKLAVSWDQFKESVGGFLDKLGAGSLISTWTDVLTNGILSAKRAADQLNESLFKGQSTANLEAQLNAERELLDQATNNLSGSEAKKAIELHMDRIDAMEKQIALNKVLEDDENTKKSARDKEAKDLKDKTDKEKANEEARKKRDADEKKAIEDKKKATAEWAKEVDKIYKTMKSQAELEYEQQQRTEAAREKRTKDFNDEENAFNPDTLPFMGDALDRELEYQDERIKAEKEANKKIKEDREKLNEAMKKTAETALAMYTSVINAQYNNVSAGLDNEYAALETQYKKKEITEEQYQQKKEQIDLRARKLQHDKAVKDKEFAIFKAVIDTASAVAQAFKDYGWPFNMVVAAIMAGLGAAQISAISSTPLPKYEKGRKGGKAEWAIVHPGEAIESQGSIKLTPEKEALTYLPQGATVHTKGDVELMKSLAFGGLLVNEKKQVGFDLTKLAEQQSRENAALIRAVEKSNKQSELKIKGLYDSMSYNAYVEQNFRH